MKRVIVILTTIALLAAGCASSGDIILEAPPFSVDTGIDPDSWALVPAGAFLEGLHEHEIMVDYDYEIMVTDATTTQFADYLNDAMAAGAIKIADNQVVGYYPGDEFDAYNHEVEIPAGDWLHLWLENELLTVSYDGATFSVVQGYENHPMVLVTWFGAQAYCDYYNWRLPTEIEWEKAARGTDGRPFPWGDEIARNNANYYSSNDLFEKLFNGLGGTTPVGLYNGQTYQGHQTLDSPSPYGLFDMAGNVWQWTGDVYRDTHLRYMRGGSKADYAYNLRVWTRNTAGPDYASINIGFRCARDVTQ